MGSCWLICIGLYLSLNGMLVIAMFHWDPQSAIGFLSSNGTGEHSELAEVPLGSLVFGLDLACAIQIIVNCLALLRGVVLHRRSSLVFWLWTHAFLLAFFFVYLLAGTLLYSFVRDESKVLLLLYGFVSLVTSGLAWKLVFDYVRDMDREPLICQ